MVTVSEAEPRVPASVLLVRDFVNSVELQTGHEGWASPSDLSRWCRAHLDGWTGRATAADLRSALVLREGLRDALLAHAGHAPVARHLQDTDALLRVTPLRMGIDAAGALRIIGADASDPVARVLAAVEEARVAGAWDRLKACSRDTCRWAYWDGSRNGSGRWCSMEGCGNWIKMRRRNGTSDPADVVPSSSGGTRPATMVDVAARSGVSAKTVSNVVTRAVPVADETRARVERAIAELGFVPNEHARQLRRGAVRSHA